MTVCQRPLWILIAASAALLLVGACGGSKPAPEPTSTPEPTPTPTPTPAPSTAFRLITADPSADPIAFAAALPASERRCLQDRLGAAGFDTLLAGSGFSGEAPAELLECLSNETLGGIIVGGALSGDADGAELVLSPETTACMGERVRSVDFASIFTSLASNDTGAGLAGATGGIGQFAQVLFCLNDAERAALEGTLFGSEEGGPAITLDTVECLFDAAGPEGMAALFGMAGATDSRDPAGGFSGTAASPELIGALIQCGGELFRSGGGPGAGIQPGGEPLPPEAADTGLTAEQLDCLSGRLGDEAVQGLASGGGGLQLGLRALAAARECGVDLAALLN